MIVLDVVQGSPEWQRARLGIPTASRFEHILTPKTRKLSTSSGRYMCELLAERMLGFPVHEVSSGFMERGSELEARAASAYELENDVETERVGFVLRDDQRSGCSPDRLVGDKGGVQIKCVSAHVHIGALLGMEHEGHFAQVQGEMWVTEREWWDLMFYNPAMPSRTFRFVRDDDYIAALESAVPGFCDRLDAAERQLRATYGDTMFAGAAALVPQGMDAHPASGYSSVRYSDIPMGPGTPARVIG